jgi:hypothetical protein
VSVVPEPVTPSTTLAPWTGLPAASSAVTVMLLVSLSVEIDVGVATTVDCVALTAPDVTETVAVCVTAMVPSIVADTTLSPTSVEEIEPVV